MFPFTNKKNTDVCKFWGEIDEEDFQNGGLPFFQQEHLMYYYSG